MIGIWWLLIYLISDYNKCKSTLVCLHNAIIVILSKQSRLCLIPWIWNLWILRIRRRLDRVARVVVWLGWLSLIVRARACCQALVSVIELLEELHVLVKIQGDAIGAASQVVRLSMNLLIGLWLLIGRSTHVLIILDWDWKLVTGVRRKWLGNLLRSSHLWRLGVHCRTFSSGCIKPHRPGVACLHLCCRHLRRGHLHRLWTAMHCLTIHRWKRLPPWCWSVHLISLRHLSRRHTGWIRPGHLRRIFFITFIVNCDSLSIFNKFPLKPDFLE